MTLARDRLVDVMGSVVLPTQRNQKVWFLRCGDVTCLLTYSRMRGRPAAASQLKTTPTSLRYLRG